MLVHFLAQGRHNVLVHDLTSHLPSTMMPVSSFRFGITLEDKVALQPDSEYMV